MNRSAIAALIIVNAITVAVLVGFYFDLRDYRRFHRDEMNRIRDALGPKISVSKPRHNTDDHFLVAVEEGDRCMAEMIADGLPDAEPAPEVFEPGLHVHNDRLISSHHQVAHQNSQQGTLRTEAPAPARGHRAECE